jgi:hypothetical protein
VGGGQYEIVNANSGKCVDVSAASTANGANIQLWTCNGTGAQRFRVNDVGGGFKEIINTNSSRCLDVSAQSTATGANVVQWDCWGGTNQQWSANVGCPGVTVYQHTNYGGYAVTLSPGDYNLGALSSRGVVNDDVSSVRVPSGCSATNPGARHDAQFVPSVFHWPSGILDEVSSFANDADECRVSRSGRTPDVPRLRNQSRTSAGRCPPPTGYGELVRKLG